MIIFIFEALYFLKSHRIIYQWAYTLDDLCGALTNLVQSPNWSKFHGESYDLFYIFQIFTSHFCIANFIKKMFFFYLTVSCSYSTFLGSCRNEWQRVGRYNEGHKILHEISIKSAIEQDLLGHRTGHLMYLLPVACLALEKSFYSSSYVCISKTLVYFHFSC